jgi:hypothetical protein
MTLKSLTVTGETDMTPLDMPPLTVSSKPRTAWPRVQLTLDDIKLLEPITREHIVAARTYLANARAAFDAETVCRASGLRYAATMHHRRAVEQLTHASRQRRAIEHCRERAERDVWYRADTIAAAIRVSHGLPARAI